jgi:hypothetical protein
MNQQLTNGQTVKTVYGNTVTVMYQWDNVVYTYQGVYHISKLLVSTAKHS